jgi:electron transfer flavoprotein beta subunit
MKVLVAVKHAVDHNLKPSVDPMTGQVDLSQARKTINPFDEISIEEAVRLKERGLVSEILAVAIGNPDARDSLRHAYAMGADRALLIESESNLQPLAVARVLKVIIEREQPGLVLLGKQAVGQDYGQTGSMLAALLGIGVGTFVSAIEINDGFVDVTREIEKGTQKIRLKLPAVLTADLRLNEPRFIKLPNLMMAKKKSIETLAVTDLGVDLAPRFSTLKSAEPPQKPGAIRLSSVQELISTLRKAEVLP